MTARNISYRIPEGLKQVRFNLEGEFVTEMDTAVAALGLDSRLALVRRAVSAFFDDNRRVIDGYKRLRRRAAERRKRPSR